MLTTWIVVKEKDGSSEYCSEQSVVEHTRSIDTNEVEKYSTQKVEENKPNVEDGINADSLRLTQGTGRRSYCVLHRTCCVLCRTCCILHRTIRPIGKEN